ncbi:ubiquinol:oxygen oxidoreductase [Fragilaria crotonensis]|nr:ubiquinol:oxygen oxidoreductase [Fragilaria crotonensis]
MKLIISVVVLAFLDGAFCFAPVKSMTSRQSKLFSMETETKMDETEEMYLEIEYEGFFDGTKPDSSWNLAASNFVRQGKTIIDEVFEIAGIKERDPLRPPACLRLSLPNKAVADAEAARIAAGGGVDAHPVSLALYDLGCLFLDGLFDERPIQRFWFLETIARIPYFSYVSMLHLYESFGWFRAVELRKVHAAEGRLLR